MGKKVIHGGLILRATLASGSGHDLLTVNPSTGEVGAISGTPLTTTLTAGQVFLGNSSNVATATAMSGDVTINSSGVTAIASGVIVNADVNASAAIAHSKMAALTASRALVSDGSGVVSVSATTSTELGYVSGVTSAIQTQLNAKQATVTGAATTIVSSDLTANRALISGTLGKVEVSSVTNTELGYLSGVTSAIQTQFSGKLSATISGAAEGDIIYYNGTNWVNLARGANGETLQSTGTSIQWASATANGIAAGGADGQVLTKQSGTDFDADWETLTVASITDLTATAAELNLLDGVTATTTEINYLDGVTSNIQSQLGNKLSTSLPHNAIFVGNISNVAASLAAGSEGQILSISSGTPTWTTISASGVTTIAALDGTTKSANGAAISGVNLYLQTADDTYPGVVSTGTQTFAGVKTFNDNIGIGSAPGGYSLYVDGQTFIKDGILTLETNTLSSVAPELHYLGLNGRWISGIDVANNGGATDFVVAAKINSDDTVNDIIYLANNGANAPTIGLGVTPPDSSYRVQISPQDSETTMGGLGIRVPPGSPTGHALAVYNSSGTPQWYIQADYKMSPVKFKNEVLNKKIALFDSSSNEHQFYGFGVNASTLRYQTPSSSDNHVWYAGTSSTTSDTLMSLMGTGKLGIGQTNPTAVLHLKAGTATANTAPLKLTTGTALTTPEDGAMEYHSSNLYFTIGSTRYQLNGLIGSTGSTDNAILRADGTGGLTAQNSSATIDDSGNIQSNNVLFGQPSIGSGNINGITTTGPSVGLSLYNPDGNVSNVTPSAMTIYGGSAYTVGDNAGGNINITPGKGNGSGVSGNVTIDLTPSGHAAGDLVIEGLASDSSASNFLVINGSNQVGYRTDIGSGTWTPTLTNITNVASNLSFVCQYLRVGSTVSFSGTVRVTPTASGTTTIIHLSLPVASNFTAGEQCGGTAVALDTALAMQSARLSADATSDVIDLRYVPSNTNTHNFYFSGSYQVL